VQSAFALRRTPFCLPQHFELAVSLLQECRLLLASAQEVTDEQREGEDEEVGRDLGRGERARRRDEAGDERHDRGEAEQNRVAAGGRVGHRPECEDGAERSEDDRVPGDDAGDRTAGGDDHDGVRKHASRGQRKRHSTDEQHTERVDRTGSVGGVDVLLDGGEHTRHGERDRRSRVEHVRACESHGWIVGLEALHRIRRKIDCDSVSRPRQRAGAGPYRERHVHSQVVQALARFER
jgi:hypothetical protein